MVSAPYIMVTPAIGNSRDGRYFVKFGDDASQQQTRIATYTTTNPPGNRTSAQLPGAVNYLVDGTMMKNQIFGANNPFGRHAFTQVGGTEWFEVWPRNAFTGLLDSTQLNTLVTRFNDAIRVPLASQPANYAAGVPQPFVNWLNGALPDTWRQ